MKDLKKTKRIVIIFMVITMLIPSAIISRIIRADSNDKSIEIVETIQMNDEISGLDSNRFTHMESTREVIQKHDNLSDFTLMGENQDLKLYINKKSLSIKIQDKTTGYLWSSDREFREDEQLNKFWKNYILSGITIDYYDAKKKKVERTSILNEKAKVKVVSEDNKIRCEIDFNKLDISFQVYLFLDDNRLKVHIPYNEIVEEDKNKLTSIIAFPFLGSTEGNEIPGYIFVPDGSGALMRFEERSIKLNSPFTAKIYGKDYGVDLITLAAENSNAESYRLSLPVYGIVHGAKKNAFLAKINSGSAYGNLMVYPSGVTTSYNWATYQFLYRQEYFHPTGKDGSGFSDLQQDMNQFNVELEYAFLHNQEADYIGMAHYYQSQLFEDIKNAKSEIGEQTVPLRIDILGSEIKKALFGFSTNVLTKPEDVIGMVDDLRATGIQELLLVYKGWSKGGISSKLPSKFPFDNKQGGSKEFIKLISHVEEQGGKLYFATDYSTAYEKGSGYNKRKDLIRRIDDLPLSFTKYFSNYEIEWYTLNPSAMERIAGEDIEKFKKYGMDLALDKTSYQLFGDYQKGPNREDTKHRITDLCTEFSDQLDLIMYKPNDYLLGITDAYLDIPMNASGYLFFTDTVPFLQILLNGYVDYYTPYLNYSSNPREDLLKTIEFGAFPSFIVTDKSPYELDDTPSGYIYSSEYDIWKERIVGDAIIIQDALAPVVNAKIEDRIVIAEGVIEVKYSNNYRIYVNYNESDYSLEDRVIRGNDFLVVNGGE